MHGFVPIADMLHLVETHFSNHDQIGSILAGPDASASLRALVCHPAIRLRVFWAGSERFYTWSMKARNFGMIFRLPG